MNYRYAFILRNRSYNQIKRIKKKTLLNYVHPDAESIIGRLYITSSRPFDGSPKRWVVKSELPADHRSPRGADNWFAYMYNWVTADVAVVDLTTIQQINNDGLLIAKLTNKTYLYQFEGIRTRTYYDRDLSIWVHGNQSNFGLSEADL